MTCNVWLLQGYDNLCFRTSGGVKRCQVDSVDPDEQGHQKMVIQLKEAKSGASARYVCVTFSFSTQL